MRGDQVFHSQRYARTMTKIKVGNPIVEAPERVMK